MPEILPMRHQLIFSPSDCHCFFWQIDIPVVSTRHSAYALEGAIVTHVGALLAFHDLRGVDVWARRLEVEVGGS